MGGVTLYLSVLQGHSAKLNMVAVLLVLLLFSCCFCQDPNYDSCKIASKTWNTEKAKTLILNVTSFEDCTNSCRNDEKYYCSFFTWNDENHPYFKNTCALFSEAEREVECDHCISGVMSCFCDNPTACKDTGSNLVAVHIGISEYQCALRCNLNTQCSHYTSFTTQHIYSKLCLLYSTCALVDNTCAGCCSGSKTFDPCTSDYKELSSSVRHVFSTHPDSVGKKYQDSILERAEKYSWVTLLPDWQDKGWYRFTGLAGSRLADKFPGWSKCGSKEPAYLRLDENNQLPTAGVGKPMAVCKPSDYRKDRCKYKQWINVMNCGDFFIYELDNINDDHTYCGAGATSDTKHDCDDDDCDGIPDDDY